MRKVVAWGGGVGGSRNHSCYHPPPEEWGLNAEASVYMKWVTTNGLLPQRVSGQPVSKGITTGANWGWEGGGLTGMQEPHCMRCRSPSLLP